MKRTAKEQRTTAKGVRITVFSDNTTNIQKMVSGEIISINDAQPAGVNSNGTPFYIANVKADINGKEQAGTALIWENQLKTDKLSEGTWAPGAPIRLAINLVGPHKGKASVELPGANPFSLDFEQEVMDGEVADILKELNVGDDYKVSA